MTLLPELLFLGSILTGLKNQQHKEAGVSWEGLQIPNVHGAERSKILVSMTRQPMWPPLPPCTAVPQIRETNADFLNYLCHDKTKKPAAAVYKQARKERKKKPCSEQQWNLQIFQLTVSLLVCTRSKQPQKQNCFIYKKKRKAKPSHNVTCYNSESISQYCKDPEPQILPPFPMAACTVTTLI